MDESFSVTNPGQILQEYSLWRNGGKRGPSLKRFLQDLADMKGRNAHDYLCGCIRRA